MSREQVTVTNVVCDGCGSTISANSKSGTEAEHQVKLGVSRVKLSESCLRDALKDAGLA